MINDNDTQYLTLTKKQRLARKNRALGVLIAVLLFALLIYIATYAKLVT